MQKVFKEKMKDIITREFAKGFSLFDRIYMIAMILVQVIIYCVSPDSVLGIVAGISGIISVLLCTKGKISFYFIGFVQTISYLILSWQNYFYGEVLENIFYLVTMVWGIFIWKKNLNVDEEGSAHVKVLKFSLLQWVLSIVASVVATVAMGYWLTTIGSHQAYTDAATNILSIFAQLLMVRRYREQWIWWLVIDILGVKMWAVAGNWSMVAMYAAWIINCLYGWYNWNKLDKSER